MKKSTMLLVGLLISSLAQAEDATSKVLLKAKIGRAHSAVISTCADLGAVITLDTNSAVTCRMDINSIILFYNFTLVQRGAVTQVTWIVGGSGYDAFFGPPSANSKTNMLMAKALESAL
jgi:hypothetical protein